MRSIPALAALTLLAALAAPTQASPLAGAAPGSVQADAAAETVKWKGHKAHKGNRGRHYGWYRGKRKGHYKRAYRYRYF